MGAEVSLQEVCVPVFFAPKSFLALIAVFSLGSALAGCESVSGSDNPSTMDTKPVDITSPGLNNAPLSNVPSFLPPNDRDLKTMTSKLSGGSVEIYDLDGGAPEMGAPVPAVQPVYNGIPMATDPRVTVYPLDGVTNTYTQMAASAPVPQWPNAVLPVTREAAPGMTAPPTEWGGDAPMQIVDGKLAPREGGDISSVYFNYGSSQLGSPERSVLRKVSETAKFAPVDRVSVEGHASKAAQTTDPIKARILNLKESMNRAQAVSQEMIENGVPAEKIKAVGWGDTKQVSGNEAAQRRVDVITGLQ